MSRILYLLTASYPYATSEPFLETEILFLAKVFEKIVIIPLSCRSGLISRETPSNCVVLPPIITDRKMQYLRGLFGYRALRLFIREFLKKRVFLSKKKFREWIIGYILANNYLHSQQIKNLFQKLHSNDILYSYWGKGGSYVFPYIIGKAILISRFHGEWDLWEESGGDYAPIRNDIIKSLDLAIFISQKGENYFRLKYPMSCKTLVSRLGTINKGFLCRNGRDNLIRILSCSTVYPLKRVPLIYDALQLIEGVNIEWTHIGAGPKFNDLKEIVKKSRKNVTVKLLGEVANTDVHNYYQSHNIDIFINVSENEGIPVSLMEAISYNIPIIGTDVGANSEIVTKKTGILLSSNPSRDEIVSAILRIKNKQINSRDFWNVYYNAEINYSAFALTLKNL